MSGSGFAIQTGGGEHLGFLLMTGNGDRGDCIFRCLPEQNHLFETAAGELLNKLSEAGRFLWKQEPQGIQIHDNAGQPIGRITDSLLEFIEMALPIVKLKR